MGGILEQFDGAIADILSGWNIYSSILAVGIVGFVGWVIYDTTDADTHPLLLARQAQASYVRQAGESAVFRSPETPHGYPLRTGLAVKPPGVPLYSAGKDGDLRDIWRRVTGEIPLEKSGSSSGTATIMTVFGKMDIETHKVDVVGKEIAVIGKYLKDHAAKRVAIYQPNSIEFLAALFAGAFYGFTPVLVPYNLPHPIIVELLVRTGADTLIAEAGTVPLDDITRGAKGLRHIIWTVEKTNRHMDWSEVPEGTGSKIDVSVWHELVQDQKNGVAQLPSNTDTPPGVVFVWGETGKSEIVEFTQQNLVAAIGALTTSLPAVHRLNPSDTFLAVDAFTSSYCLCLTLAALFSHSTVMINSVAGPGVDVTLASRFIAPTVTVIGAETAAKLHSETNELNTGGLQKLAHYFATRSLTAGRLPQGGMLSTIGGDIGNTPGKLRLMFTSDRLGLDSPPLSSNELSDLRIYTKARIAYALTTAKVAGAVAQTNIYDYRRELIPSNKHSHFGVPLSCVEIKLKDTSQYKTTDEQSIGELVVNGSSVVGGEVNLGVNATVRDDHTLAYV